MSEKISDDQEQKDGMTEKKKRGITRGFIAGVHFLKRKRRIIGKKEIMSILPHGKTKLFLDRVIITPRKIIGEFLVTLEACEDHEIEGQLLFRGVDYSEMIAQLLVIWIAQQVNQHPILNEKSAYLRKASFKNIGPVIPGDLLRAEILVVERNEENDEEGNPRIETITSTRDDRPVSSRQQAIAVNAEVWVGDKKKAIIYFVGLGIADIMGLAE